MGVCMKRMIPINERIDSELSKGLCGPMSIPNVIGSYRSIGSIARKVKKP
jgi:hypothetical protein